MFGKRLSLEELAGWSRAVAGSLRSGVSVMRTLSTQAERGSPRVSEASRAVLMELEGGADVAGAIAQTRAYFPPLFVSLCQVGVRTGHLPEILSELERYFRLQITLRRQFIQQITWPVVQLVMAIFVIALVIYLMGLLGGLDVLGIGLTGGRGALIWLGGWVALGGAGYFGLRLARGKFGQAERIDELVLRLPVFGPVAQTLALSRLTLAMHLTMESGMSLKRAIPLSLDASDNAWMKSQSREIVAHIQEGHPISEAFERHGIFPPDLLDRLANAEEAGKVPEAMKQLSSELNERAEYQLHLLNQSLGWIVWLIVAGIIIFFIFRIAMVAYIGPIYETLDQLPGGRI